MKENPKILIGTLYSGENELEECINSVKAQKYKRWEHKIIKNLPNKLAHETLYNMFMENGNEYDLFVKLDADMVFKSNDSLNLIVRLFLENDKLDHAVIAVIDWYSDSLITGLHTFSNRVKWYTSNEQLFVDETPIYTGNFRLYWGDPAPIAQHSPNPSFKQAFQFGIHRGLKAMQYGRKKFNRTRSKEQRDLINKIWNNFVKYKDIRYGLVILGVDKVIKNKRKFKESEYKELELNIEELSTYKLYSKLKSRWGNKYKRNIYLNKEIFVKNLVYKVYDHLKKTYLTRFIKKYIFKK